MSDHTKPPFSTRPSHHWLSRTVTPALLVLSLGLPTSGRAELVLTTDAPAFSAHDRQTIERNEMLRAALGREPWLVFKVLRELRDTDRTRDVLLSRDPGVDRDFDAELDPDLEQFQRVSPEAAHDLFLLLKKAGRGGAK